MKEMAQGMKSPQKRSTWATIRSDNVGFPSITLVQSVHFNAIN